MPSHRPFGRPKPARVASLAGAYGRHARLGAHVPSGAFAPQQHKRNPFGRVSSRTARYAGIASSYGKAAGSVPQKNNTSTAEGSWTAFDPKAQDIKGSGTSSGSGGGGGGNGGGGGGVFQNVDWSQAVTTGLDIVGGLGIGSNPTATPPPMGPQAPGSGPRQGPVVPQQPESKGVPGWAIGLGLGLVAVGTAVVVFR